MNFNKKLNFEAAIVVTFLASILCFVLHAIIYRKFSISSIPFWIGIALIALFLVLCIAYRIIKRRDTLLQANHCLQELQNTKYISFEMPLRLNVRNPLKRQFDVTLYKEIDEKLLIEYCRLLNFDEDEKIEKACIGEFKATLQEVLSIKGKNVVMFEYDFDEKTKLLLHDFLQNNRIITYDHDD